MSLIQLTLGSFSISFLEHFLITSNYLCTCFSFTSSLPRATHSQHSERFCWRTMGVFISTLMSLMTWNISDCGLPAMAGRKPPNSGFQRCATETQTISVPERAREPHTHQVMTPTETTATMQGGHFKSEPRISLHNLPSGNCKFGLWAQILPRKLAFTCFYRKK